MRPRGALAPVDAAQDAERRGRRAAPVKAMGNTAAPLDSQLLSSLWLL